MAITETTPVVETKWLRLVWLLFAMLAIVTGGALGHWVANREPEPLAAAPQPAPPIAQPIAQPTAQPILEPPAPSSLPPGDPPAVASDPEPDIQMQPESVKPAAGGINRHATPKPKPRPKPTKTRPCNVYDHMDGC